MLLDRGLLPGYIDMSLPIDIIKAIVDHGYSLNDGIDYTLQEAAVAGKNDVVELLLALGANPTIYDYTLLDSCKLGNIETVKILIRSEFFSNEIRNFIEACIDGNVTAIESLLHDHSESILISGIFCTVHNKHGEAFYKLIKRLLSVCSSTVIEDTFETMMKTVDARFLSALAQSNSLEGTIYGQILDSAYHESLKYLIDRGHASKNILSVVAIAWKGRFSSAASL